MPRKPPYALAALATLVVLTGYVITLAPTVTFWDAGEFIAAAKTLGIPHPPGTPLFVMIAHVWAAIVPFGEFAQRTNLLSATMSACGAGCMFLVVHESLSGFVDDLEERLGRTVQAFGAFAAVVIGGFTFTTWQNSNETEVYAAACFTIAAIAWLCLRWRAVRGTERAAHLLLLILYLAGISIGNHLLALLAGPAVVAFLVITLLDRPAASAEVRAAEWAQAAVVAGTWALLIGGGLGSTTLTVVGGLAYIAAFGFAIRGKSVPFAIVALVVAFIGITSYFYLFIRAGFNPPINEAQPDNWNALLAVIRREQYPVRTPLDDPTILHGPDNPGRSLTMFGMQLANYFLYFDWQWGNSVKQLIGGVFPVRTIATLLFTFLGFRGMIVQRRSDKSAWWLLFMLWLVTGLGLVVYMNFKPGFSLFHQQYPQQGDHEVRERDYFFVVSFIVWGLWAGIGLASFLGSLVRRARLAPMLAAIPLGLIALTPFISNFNAATRRQGPDARLAADFAYDLLNSVPPNGILFTYGDNDTFPLWWAQEVAGIRQDVLVVCLALTETDWYKGQLRDWPSRPFDRASAPAIWKDAPSATPTWPAHTMTAQDIQNARGTYLPQDIPIRIGSFTHVLKKGTPFYSRDFTVIRILMENAGKRPVAWSVTTGGDFYGLQNYVVQQGMVQMLQPGLVDTTRADLDFHRILGTALDVPTTDRLMNETYRYADLLKRPVASELEPTAAGVASNLALPYAQLTYAYQAAGKREEAVKAVERATLLSPNPALKRALVNLVAEQPGDTAAPR
jgi:hypothetical protein